MTDMNAANNDDINATNAGNNSTACNLLKAAELGHLPYSELNNDDINKIRAAKIREKFRVIPLLGLGKKPHEKLKDFQVQWIRMFHYAGYDAKAIADCVNISYHAINDIIKGNSWRNLPYCPPLLEEIIVSVKAAENNAEIKVKFDVKQAKIISIFVWNQYNNELIVPHPTIVEHNQLIIKWVENIEDCYNYLKYRVGDDFKVLTIQQWDKFMRDEMTATMRGTKKD